ncbi:hypothetical protein Q664_03920 [Archangium violaceum Cb vi76]|uniref:Uncharacterized protein n=1 Tax=Archangium violaceum Cb vi76 TaxID=1406225 RepID=A0A084T0I3_9BACT|nr:hypothetical protein Q664_03920 [Archangium violaceum Cb vi76]
MRKLPSPSVTTICSPMRLGEVAVTTTSGTGFFVSAATTVPMMTLSARAGAESSRRTQQRALLRACFIVGATSDNGETRPIIRMWPSWCLMRGSALHHRFITHARTRSGAAPVFVPGTALSTTGQAPLASPLPSE